MDFFNRNAKKVSQKAWTELFSRPGYVEVKETKLAARIVVRTWWAGVGLDFEGDEPRIFCTEVLSDLEKADTFKPLQDPVWDTTEGKALQTHRRLTKEYT